MAYEKQTWVDLETPLDAEHMNHIEDGIEANAAGISQLTEEIEEFTEDIKIVNSKFEDVNLLDGVTWEVGTVDQYIDGLPDNPSTTRIRTKGFVSIKGYKKITFSVSDGYKYVVDYADDSGAIVNVNKHGLWQTGTASYSEFGKATKIRMLVADASNGTASVEYAEQLSAIANSQVETLIGEAIWQKTDTVFAAERPAKDAYFESDGNNGLYFKIDGNLFIRGENYDTFVMSTAFRDSLVTSPNGVEGCVHIPHNSSLLYSPSSHRLSIQKVLTGENNIVIFAVAAGRPYDGADGVISGIGQWFYLEYLIAHQSPDILPAYWESEIASVTPVALEKAMSFGRDGESFIFLTDLHWLENAKNSPGITKALVEKLGIERIVLGGDYFNNGEKTEMALMTSDCIGSFRALNCDLFPLVGNHDSNEIHHDDMPERWFGDTGVYALLNNHLRNVDYGGYCYYSYDNELTKTRYICLDTRLVGDALSEAQRTWFNATLSGTPAGYKVLIFAHIIYQPDSWDVPFVDTLARTAFMDEICTLADTFNTSNEDKEVVAIIGGHIHLDMTYTTDGGIPIILCDCDTRKTYSDVGDALGTINEQCVSIFNIDYTARKIYMTRVGRGEDLELTY